MQAIQTRYIGPSNTRGSRIRAWCAAGATVVPFPYDADSQQQAHRMAHDALHRGKLGWSGDHYGELLGGCLPGGDYCFVLGNQWAKE